MESSVEKIDRFRYIPQTHTTVRQLIICSRIVRIVGNKHLPLNFLQESISRWSKEEEIKSIVYSGVRGKITDQGKPTTSFKHYVRLCQELGLISNLNSIISLTRTTYILFRYFPEKVSQDFLLAGSEKLLFLYFLLKEDADTIISILEELANFKGSSVNQKDLLGKLMNKSDGSFEKRLMQKQNFSTGLVKSSVGEKLRKIMYEWNKKQVYAEHIFVPRLEWLHQLGLISIHSKGQTFYKLEEKGNELLNLIPLYKETNFKDLNDDWIRNHYMELCDKMNLQNPGDKEFTINFTKERIGEYILEAYHVQGWATSFRMPLLSTILFIIFGIFIDDHTMVEISQMYELLENGFKFDSKIFRATKSARISESYITINPI